MTGHEVELAEFWAEELELSYQDSKAIVRQVAPYTENYEEE